MMEMTLVMGSETPNVHGCSKTVTRHKKYVEVGCSSGKK